MKFVKIRHKQLRNLKTKTKNEQQKCEEWSLKKRVLTPLCTKLSSHKYRQKYTNNCILISCDVAASLIWLFWFLREKKIDAFLCGLTLGGARGPPDGKRISYQWGALEFHLLKLLIARIITTSHYRRDHLNFYCSSNVQALASITKSRPSIFHSTNDITS